MLEPWMTTLLGWIALPEIGLSSVFIVSFVSATLLPLGSEPAVFGMVKLRPDLFWATIAVATAGNTLGGILDYWIGYGAHRAIAPEAPTAPGPVFRWLERLGPVACFFAFLPIVGDPLCSVAGWLGLPFWRCAVWMALGKFLRYVFMTAGLIWAF